MARITDLADAVADLVRDGDTVALEEHSQAGMANRYVAGASGLPFAVLRGYRGTDLVRHTSTLRTVTCPFTGEEPAAVPAVNPDVTIVHAQQADRSGNVHLWGITGVQKEALPAARRTLGTVEEVVDTFEPHSGDLVIPGWALTAVAVVPGGWRRSAPRPPRRTPRNPVSARRQDPVPWRSAVCGARGSGERGVHDRRDDDCGRGASADRGRDLLRGDRAAQHRGQPGAAPARAEAGADLREWPPRREAGPPAAVDRRRDPATCELTLTAVHPGVEAATVRERTGWELRVADDLAVGEPPGADELRLLRELEATTGGVR